MRVTIVMPYLPYPVDIGGNAAMFQVARGLARRNEVTALVAVWNDQQAALVEDLRRAWGDVTVVPARITGLHWPRGVIPFKHHLAADLISPEMNAAVQQIIAERRADVLQFEFLRSASFAPARSPVPQVLVEHEILALRQLREGWNQRNWLDKWRLLKGAYFTAREAAQLYRRFHAIVTFTEVDRSHVLRLSPRAQVTVSPFGVDTEQLTPPQRSEPSQRLVYIGGDAYWPNVDAVGHFLSSIFPLIRSGAPEVQFDVIGKWSEAKQAEMLMLAPEGVNFRGYVPDLRLALANAILVAPIRVGSGLRTKILEGMAVGCAVVSTAIGCEGIPAVSNEQLLVEDDPAAFARRVVMLLRDPVQRDRLGRGARALVEREYALDVVVRKREIMFAKMLEQRTAQPT